MTAQNHPDWPALPISPIPIDRLVWPCHDINPDHLHEVGDVPLSTGPIHVERLTDGSYFIHDGRHRAIRAQQTGAATIHAHVLP